MFVRLSFIPKWGVKWNVSSPSVCLRSQYEGEIKPALSVCLCKTSIWRVKFNVVCPTVCLAWIPILGVKRNGFCVFVLLGSQHEEWNDSQFVRLSVLNAKMRGETMRSLSDCLSYFYPNMRGEMKRTLPICLSKTTILEVKWNIVRLSVLSRFQYEGWNEPYLSVCLSCVYSNLRVKWSVVFLSVWRKS